MKFLVNSYSSAGTGPGKARWMIMSASRFVALACAIILVLSVSGSGRAGGSEPAGDGAATGRASDKSAEGTRNFIELHDVYLKWRDGYFGSRSHYRNHLYFLLLDMMGHRIVTGYDYILLSPELIYERKLKFAFYNGDWLHIEGKVDIGSVKKIIGDDSSLLMTWWRSRKLVAVSGILRDYRIDDWDKKVYVVMDDIQVKTPGMNVK